MLTTLEMARPEFGFYAAHVTVYNGEAEPLHGHTFHVTVRMSGEPDASGMVAEFSKITPAMQSAVARLRRRTLLPGYAPELQITQNNNSLSIIAGRKQYVLPIEDVTVRWSETLSPFVTVAKLRLPQQDIGGEDNLERMDATSMTAWRVTEAHRPLGNIMRARKEVYRQSSLLRHQANNQVRKEPKNLAEVFGA